MHSEIIDSFTSSSIFKSSIKISFDREWFTSHVFWEIEINELASTSKTRMFFAQFRQMQSHKQWSLHTIHVTSYLNATISSVFETIEFEIFKFTHARENLSRKFSISIHVFWFSKIFHSISICKRCQEHFVIYLFSSWFASTVSRIENSEILMKISALRKYWSEKITKIVVFEFLVSDFFIWRSHYFGKILDRVNLLCFYFFARSITHLKKLFFGSSSMLLFYCLFILHFINRLIRLTLRKLLAWRSQKLLFVVVLLICKNMTVLLCDCSFWFSTITHLFSIILRLRCRTINTRKKKTERTIKPDRTIRKRIRCVTVQFRKNVLYSYSSNEFTSMMYF